MEMKNPNKNKETEVVLTTFDGPQHVRLHSWLKKNDVIIRSEIITEKEEYFGVFTVYIFDKTLETLKKENLEKNLFMDLENMGTDSERWNLFKDLFSKNPLDLNNKIPVEDFLFNFTLKSKEDIEKQLEQIHEISLGLFKKNKDFIKEYVQGNELTKEEKLSDLEHMIQYFIENGERYEDCALLTKIKNKVILYYEKQNQKNIR